MTKNTIFSKKLTDHSITYQTINTSNVSTEYLIVYLSLAIVRCNCVSIMSSLESGSICFSISTRSSSSVVATAAHLDIFLVAVISSSLYSCLTLSIFYAFGSFKLFFRTSLSFVTFETYYDSTNGAGSSFTAAHFDIC